MLERFLASGLSQNQFAQLQDTHPASRHPWLLDPSSRKGLSDPTARRSLVAWSWSGSKIPRWPSRVLRDPERATPGIPQDARWANPWASVGLDGVWDLSQHPAHWIFHSQRPAPLPSSRTLASPVWQPRRHNPLPLFAPNSASRAQSPGPFSKNHSPPPGTITVPSQGGPNLVNPCRFGKGPISAESS